MNSPQRAIPLYSLYGEKTPVEDTEFVHIEEIESRSSLYDWEIDPHSHANLLQILLISEGHVHVEIDDQSAEQNGPCIISIPAGVVHGFRFSPQTKGVVISAAHDFLNMRPNPADAQTLHEVMHFPAIVDFANSPGRFKTAQEIAQAIFNEFRWPQSGRSMMFDAYIRILLLQVRRKMVLPHERDTKKNYRRTVFVRYRTLVDDHYKDKWTVPDYADHMGLTENRLNRICQTFTGKSAFEIVQDRIMLEAQRFLIYTKAPINEIAYDLGFHDPAYFCRFFKKLSGQTPKKFRQDKAD
ncbi:helix-turn-helix domain-containing protein [Terasakiella pusilla]|uniref:helix-turn-helix domain-containing protein n=1 Tax=Terasakiella pusilla TaxID=64973 RepID=UPI00068FD803|nr:helix-turn-helix domain-containing protein [Terasakiella pusilla]